MPGPYRVPTYRGHVRAVATCKAPTGPYRGVGRPISTFVMERLIDMAARRLAIDPAEVSLRNLIRAEEFPYKVARGGGTISSGSARRATLAAHRAA
jgi:aerobic carbon-monoxide dehydrogenase large subunit